MNRKEHKLAKKIINQVQYTTDKAIQKHLLIEPQDKILIGVSGGVDSMVLLETLATKKKYYKYDFLLSAVYVKIENIPYNVDLHLLQDFCNSLQIPISVFETKINIDKKQITTNPCFICSWNRRKILFNYARQNNFNKLALGHHLNDAVETFLMNLVYHSSISSLPASLTMFDGRMRLIRPLIYLQKDIIEHYAFYRKIPIADKKCIFFDVSKRTQMNKLIEIFKELNPVALRNIFSAMSNVCYEYLPT